MNGWRRKSDTAGRKAAVGVARFFLLPEENLRTPYDHTKCGLISYDDTIRSSRILGEEKRIKFWKKNVGSILARHAPGSNKT